jgi:hypothetical protein
VAVVPTRARNIFLVEAGKDGQVSKEQPLGYQEI